MNSMQTPPPPGVVRSYATLLENTEFDMRFFPVVSYMMTPIPNELVTVT